MKRTLQRFLDWLDNNENWKGMSAVTLTGAVFLACTGVAGVLGGKAIGLVFLTLLLLALGAIVSYIAGTALLVMLDELVRRR